MRICLIAAMTLARLIGKNNQLPWKLPADLRYFKKTTLGKSVMMGRKTYQSIGKPLPERENIIITRNKLFTAPQGCKIFHDIKSALDDLKNIKKAQEVFIIGGSEIFCETLPLADYLYLTMIDAPALTGDSFFPAWDPGEWQEVSREEHTADEENIYPYVFSVLKRKRK